MTFAELAEASAATHRLARLVVTDSIAEPLRDRWVSFSYALALKPNPPRSEFKPWAEVAMDDPDHPKIVELAACVHCVGIWAGIAVLILRRLPVGRTLVRLLAVTGVHSASAELIEALRR